MTSVTRRLGGVDLSFGPGHGPVSGAVNAAVTTLGVTWWARLLHLPPLAGLSLGGIAAAAAMIVLVADKRLYYHEGAALAYRGGCWLGAGVWSGWMLMPHRFGNSLTNGVIVLACAAVVAALAGAVVARAERKAEDADVAAVVAALPTPPAPDPQWTPEQVRAWKVAQEIKPMIDQATGKPLKVEGVQFWAGDTGFTVDTQLPDDGTTYADVKGCGQAVATMLNLGAGCGVEVVDGVTEGGTRRQVLWKVSTVNRMVEDRDMPDTFTPASINNDLELGGAGDGKPATINGRFDSTVITGQIHSGKSNLLNAIVLQLGRCVDEVIMAIDLTGGGRFIRPWIRPWVEGRADRPVIDAAAVTYDQAALMLLGLIQLIDVRTALYERLMFEQGVDYLPVSPQVPHITVVIDEFGKLPEQLKEMVRIIDDTGRGAAARTVKSTLRATDDYIPRPSLLQSRNRIGMRVSDEGELHHLLDGGLWTTRFDMSMIPYPGCGVLASDPFGLGVFKANRVAPPLIDRAAVALARLRPTVDAASAAYLDTVIEWVPDPKGAGKVERRHEGVWEHRWAGVLPLMFPTGDTQPAATPKPGTAAAPTAPQVDAAGVLAELDAAGTALREQISRAQDALAGDDQGGEADEEAEFQAILAESYGPDRSAWPRVDEPTTVPQPPEQRRPRALVRLVEVVHQAGPGGIGFGRLLRALAADGLAPRSRQTLYEWLEQVADEVRQPAGPRTPYIHRDHLPRG